MILDIALGIVLAVVILGIIAFGFQMCVFLLWGVWEVLKSFVEFLENLGRND